MKPLVVLIAAVARNGVIGQGGRLPWHLPEDLRRFRQITWGKSILMGRRTFESIGRPLPGRHNIVVSRTAGFKAPGCTLVRSLEEALTAVRGEELMVIGGASLYAALLPVAYRIHLTQVHADYPGDTFFPEWPPIFHEVYRLERRSEGFPHPYSFVLLERVQPGRR
ncbi:type 3 dihydrofolate reductase [Methylothermus subterraneus]